LIIRKAEFVKSAADKSGMLESKIPEFAMCGRSNVGKSTFINMLTNNGKLAKTSKDPGRTRLINYFSCNDGEFMLVDLPGYGYARVSKEEKAKWGIMIEDYLNSSTNLAGVILLLDIRHSPSSDDMIMVNYLHQTAKPFLLIATKADKLSRAQTAKQKRMLAQDLKVGEANIIAVSSLKGEGKQQVLDKMESILSFYQETV